MITEVDVILKGEPGQERACKLQATLFGPLRRTRRALGALFGCWLAAGVVFFIPGLHLFLFPILFFSAPLLAFILARKKGEFTSKAVACPRCGQEVPIAGLDYGFQFYLHCPKCAQHIFVEKVV